MLFRITSIVSIVMVLFMSCKYETINTPVDLFYKKNPDLKQKYIDLYPTSFEKIVGTVKHQYRCTHYLIEEIKSRFPNNPVLIEYLEKKQETEELFFKETMDKLKKFEKTISHDDYFFDFTYVDENNVETGLLILNNGSIKWREIHTSSIAE